MKNSKLYNGMITKRNPPIIIHKTVKCVNNIYNTENCSIA